MTYNPLNPNGQATKANSQPVVIASDQTTVPISASALPLPTGAAQDSTLANLTLAQASTTAGQTGPLVQAAVTTNAPTYTAGQTAPLSMNTLGGLRVTLNSGANAVGTVNLSPTASGGWSVSSQVSLTTSATISGATGKFGGYMFNNPNASAAYIQVFDTTGAVTLGTTTPTFVVPIPAGASANVEFSNGIAITNGIKAAATTTATGSTTVATGLTGFVLYK